jgi:hypothetical protein
VQQPHTFGLVREEIVGAIAIDVLLNTRQRFLGDPGSSVYRRLERSDPGGRFSGSLERVEKADTFA